MDEEAFPFNMACYNLEVVAAALGTHQAATIAVGKVEVTFHMAAVEAYLGLASVLATSRLAATGCN